MLSVTRRIFLSYSRNKTDKVHFHQFFFKRTPHIAQSCEPHTTHVLWPHLLNRFSSFPPSVRDFEYTPELAIFDLFEIPIFHGWVVDPQEVELAEIVRNCSYNQLVEKIIIEKADESQEKVRQGEKAPKSPFFDSFEKIHT